MLLEPFMLALDPLPSGLIFLGARVLRSVFETASASARFLFRLALEPFMLALEPFVRALEPLLLRAVEPLLLLRSVFETASASASCLARSATWFLPDPASGFGG